MDPLRLAVNVVNINGSLDKIDKFWKIQLFCNNQQTLRGQFWALVTTNALNVGIDKESFSLQIWFKWSRYLLIYFQERGRGSLCEGQQLTRIDYGDLPSYVYLSSQLDAVGNTNDDASSSIVNGNGYN